MAEISDMDWAQHINMDYSQTLGKDPVKQAPFVFVLFNLTFYDNIQYFT